MMIISYRIGELPVSSLCLDMSELSRRMQAPIGYMTGGLAELSKQLEQIIDCRYAAVKVRAASLSEWKCEEIEFRLKECEEAWVFAVTLGLRVDRWLRMEKIKGTGRHFLADALASSFAEAAAEAVDQRLREGDTVTRRFSPGYGRLPLSLQPKVLSLVQKTGFCSITIGDRYLMTPTKSITAIMGIQK